MRKLIVWNLISLLLACPVFAAVTPQSAERFTHLLGVSLADGVDFNALAKQFGASPVVQTDDAETPDSRVCYRTADGKETVEFFHGVINYGFALHAAASKDVHCPISKTITTNNLKVSELSLGMQQAALGTLLGKPVSTAPDHLVYKFQYVHTLTDAQVAAKLAEARKNGYDSDKAEDLRNWNVDIYIQAGFKDDHLSSLVVDRVETN
ncbi:MAG: hypothetical protein ACRESC_03595 [Gammaproteobacteria bacterium]